MIKVVQIPAIERMEIEKTINKNLARKGLIHRRILETVCSETKIWMPYYKIRYEFTNEGNDPSFNQENTGSGMTALNAMFSSCVVEENDLLSLFRPDIHELELVNHNPSQEVVGSVETADIPTIFDKLLEYRTEIDIERQEMAQELRQIHRRMQTMSLFLPTSKATRIREDQLTRRLAQISGVRFSFLMRLGLPDNALFTEVTNAGVFYCPQLIVSVENQQTGEDRFIIIDFVRLGQKKGGSLDDALSRLCSVDDACRATLEAVIDK
ncbi:MAG: hypothetical protein ACE5R6_00355 [Candidatus Heimdallarchaeota archaeon]